MAQTILIASGKGGVGKSTATAFFGREMADKNQKVLLIDADIGLGALDVMLGTADKTMYTWLDAVNGTCERKDAVTKVSPNLSLLPAPRVYTGDIPDDVFANIVSQYEKDYDIIFIDAAAGIDSCLEKTARAADRAIFIATADEISVKAAAAAASEAENFGLAREDMRLVINRFVKKAAIKSKLLNIDGVIDKSGVMLLGIIPEDKMIPYSSVTGVLPKEKSKFRRSIKRICARINGESVPLAL